MKSISKWFVFHFSIIMFFLCNSIVSAVGDEVVLEPVKPDSLYLMRDGENVRIRWYISPNSLTSVIGSEFYESWYFGHDEADRVKVNFIGKYTGLIDRSLSFSLGRRDNFKVAEAADGGSPSIPITIQFTDKFWEYDERRRIYNVVYETYSNQINIGTDEHYGDTIPVTVRGGEPYRVIDLGFSVYFHDGYVDTTKDGSNAFFTVDLQTLEGFHVWRKEVQNSNPEIYPHQNEMTAIAEISKEEYYLYSRITRPDEIPPRRLVNWEYFTDYGDEEAYPRFDIIGEDTLAYYEWVDGNVFPGFKYYYSVTSFDRGYYNGVCKDSLVENFVCDNDSIPCSEVMEAIWGDAPYTGKMEGIYAVPNPFRTGTSAQTTPYYHNYGDGDYVKFHHVPPHAKFWIFTVSGDLVWKTVQNSPDDGDNIIEWDGRNMEGRMVASGVFIYRCKNSNGDDTYGKIIVIR